VVFLCGIGAVQILLEWLCLFEPPPCQCFGLMVVIVFHIRSIVACLLACDLTMLA